jgi:hypothetical protein
MYVFAVAPLGPANIWGWISLGLGLLLDLLQWFTAYQNRQNSAQWASV